MSEIKVNFNSELLNMSRNIANQINNKYAFKRLSDITEGLGAEYAYNQVIPELNIPGLMPFYAIFLAIWQIRPADLQVLYPLQVASKRAEYIAWCFTNGRKEYKALDECEGFWSSLTEKASILQTPWSGGISKLIQLCILSRPDLGIDPSLKSTEDQLSALSWFWCQGGCFELDLTDKAIPRWQEQFWLNSPALSDTRFAHLVYEARADLKAAFDINTPKGAASFEYWLLSEGLNETGLKILFKPKQRAWPRQITEESLEKPFGVNLIGYAFAELGIGEDVRMAAHALKSANIPFTIINFQPGPNIRQQDLSVMEWVGKQSHYSINIVCLTALEHLRLYAIHGKKLFHNCYNIGYWPWELNNWPTEWKHCFSLIDEVWASSRHIKQSVTRASSIPVTHMPMAVKALDIDISAPKKRENLKLPLNKTLFVFSFDGNSYIERKNPQAIITAFLAAFPKGDEDVGLVIKCMRPDTNCFVWRSILETARTDSRLIILDMMLSKQDVMELYSACDCFVSLHRAEGFGRGIAEALILGLEVIATDYGGNTDYCREMGAHMIPFKLTKVKPHEYVAADDNFWAEPEISAAAEVMRSTHIQISSDRANATPSQAPKKTLDDSLLSTLNIGRRYEKYLNRLAKLL